MDKVLAIDIIITITFLQFLVQTFPKTVGGCDDIPRFVPPTPKEKTVFIAEEGENVRVELFADNGNDKTIK